MFGSGQASSAACRPDFQRANVRQYCVQPCSFGGGRGGVSRSCVFPQRASIFSAAVVLVLVPSHQAGWKSHFSLAGCQWEGCRLKSWQLSLCPETAPGADRRATRTHFIDFRVAKTLAILPNHTPSVGLLESVRASFTVGAVPLWSHHTHTQHNTTLETSLSIPSCGHGVSDVVGCDHPSFLFPHSPRRT